MTEADGEVAELRLAIEVHEASGRISDLIAATERLNASTEHAGEQARRLACAVTEAAAQDEAEALAAAEDDFYAGRGSADG